MSSPTLCPPRKTPPCALWLLLHPSPTDTTKGTRASHKLLLIMLCMRWKKRASSGLLLGQWKIPALKTQGLWKTYIYIYVFACSSSMQWSHRSLCPRGSPSAEQRISKDWGNRTEIICTDFAAFITLLSLYHTAITPDRWATHMKPCFMHLKLPQSTWPHHHILLQQSSTAALPVELLIWLIHW